MKYRIESWSRNATRSQLLKAMQMTAKRGLWRVHHLLDDERMIRAEMHAEGGQS